MKKVLHFIATQRPGDLVTMAFLVFLAVLTLFFFAHIPRAPLLLALYSFLIFIQIALIRKKKKGSLIQAIYDLGFPVICVYAVFDSLEWLVHYVNPHDIDPLLIQFDYLIFNNHPTVMLETLQHPLLTDVLQIAYTTYYFIPIIFGILLLKKNDRDAFNQSLFLLLLCFYLSYLGYILFPALGPRFTIDHLQSRELQGLFVTEPIQNLLNRLEGIKRDAFPSGHTGVALTVLYLAFRYHRTYFWICLPVVAALLFSTVYCRYHYVVDIIAGIVLTLLTIWAGNQYYRWWHEKNRQSRRNPGKG
jgi:membrane-associated phospholipid phosphatase